VYATGRVTADPETLRQLAGLSEREINRGTGLSRRIIRHIRHGAQVKPSTMQRITDFLTRELETVRKVVHPKGGVS
jgi:transcriptional regulator with XRE-family HTH domain